MKLDRRKFPAPVREREVQQRETARAHMVSGRLIAKSFYDRHGAMQLVRRHEQVDVTRLASPRLTIGSLAQQRTLHHG